MSVLTPIHRAACWGVETARLDGTRTSPQLLFYVVRLLWALGDHSPGLLHSSLHMRTLAPGRGRVGGHLVLPRGHLLVVARGCLEPLQRLVEAGPGLDGAVVTGAVGGRDLCLGVVGHVWHVAGPRPGRRVHLPVGGEGVTGGGGAVVVAAGLVAKNEASFSTW